MDLDLKLVDLDLKLVDLDLAVAGHDTSLPFSSEPGLAGFI